ncbi:isoleucine--tRNA ligase [Vaginisenegalia massiliensis]|uniref:isoleucine--tRNA ligase n=1 Tax=Vaginisenegalia massiliensis TaxID=2058294 RepID=UPI000F51D3A7|nr:isoleucine--tRNA ligase [Vaginisenegalia massiliensis]
MKLKESLNLGQTDFAMRANLPVKEVELQKEWEEADVYRLIQEKNAAKPTFMLHDGPPYANGKLHMGHALNKISKDFIVRYKSMNGFRAPFVPGWDTHGLPIETALIKQEGVDRKTLAPAEFRRLCEQYAYQQVEGQKASFRRLGVNGDWDNPYLTLKPEYEAAQIRIFGKMAEKGYIYKGLKPIYWSPSSESSLAEAEVEYHDVTSPSIFVAFKVRDGKDIVPANAEFVIWTTTPWTLPANLGISVDPSAPYVQVKVDQRHFIVAKELLESVAQTIGWTDYQVEKEYLGQDFDRLTAQHPFYDRESLLMVGDHVTMDAGTGLVHTAPGHGEDDYHIGMKYGLDILSPLDNRGHYTQEAPGLEGIFYLKGNKLVVDMLTESGALLHYSEFVHSYPHDWRTKKPVIYRATPQWFASIDKFRQDILNVIDNEVKWYHPSGQTRIYNMIRDRGDWVISRQRIWGVPLPIFYAEDGQEILLPETIEHVAQLFEQHGSNIWFEKEAKDLLPAGFTHPGSPNGHFTKEMDIMDVWFDSGTSYAGVLQERENLSYPADLYLEGSDQYRGWFNSSLTTSVAAFGCAPYKAVLSQGFVMDGKGEKMSKSLGNTILPDDVMKELGADIIRLWVASVDYESDVRVSPEILKQISESYRKIRNTIRFMLSHVSDLNPETDLIADQDLRPVDQYMLAKARIFVTECLNGYENYDFLNIYKKVVNFITVDLSAFYLDFAKDVLYIEAPSAYPRRAMQTVIYRILRDLLPLLTPILVHTMEEAWKELPGVDGFIQLAEMPTAYDLASNQAIVDQWQEFFDLRQGVQKALEEAKNDSQDPIKKSFEAHVDLYLDDQAKANLMELTSDLDQLMIVSQVELADVAQAPEDAMDFEGFKVRVSRAQGQVCQRCRAVKADVGSHADAPELCSRCYSIMKEHYSQYFEQDAE